MAALRIGPKRVLGGGRDLGQSLAFVIVVQIACPLVYAGLLLVTGWQSPLALMFAALPISGSPSTTQLTGHDGAPALLPLTVLPTFWLLPDLSGGGVFDAAFNLLLLIFVAALQALDGVSAAVLAITGDPLGLVVNLLIAFAANFGLQITIFLALRNTALKPQAGRFLPYRPAIATSRCS